MSMVCSHCGTRTFTGGHDCPAQPLLHEKHQLRKPLDELYGLVNSLDPELFNELWSELSEETKAIASANHHVTFEQSLVQERPKSWPFIERRFWRE